MNRYKYNPDANTQIDGYSIDLVQFIKRRSPTAKEIEQYIKQQPNSIKANNHLKRLIRERVIQIVPNGVSPPTTLLPGPPMKRPSKQPENSKRQMNSTVILFIAFLLVMAIPLAFSLNSFQLADKRLYDNTERHIELAAAKLAGEIDQWVDRNEHIIRLAAQLPDIISMAPERQRVVLQTIQDMHPWIYLVHTLNLKGKNVARSDDHLSMLFSDRKYFKASKAGQRYKQYVLRTNKSPAVVFSMPVKKNDRVIGVLASGVSMAAVEALIKSWRTSTGQTSSAVLLDRDYQVIAHPVAQKIGTSYRDRISNSLASQEGEGLFEFNVKKKPYIGYLIETDIGWLIIQLAKRDLYADSILERQYASLWLGGALAIFALMIWFCHHWFTVRIAHITSGIRQILLNREFVNAELVLAARRRDQLGELAKLISEFGQDGTHKIFNR